MKSIRCYYTENSSPPLDISRISIDVETLLKNQISRLSVLEKDVVEKKKKLDCGLLTYNQTLTLRKQVKELEEEIKILRDKPKIYRREVQNIIDRWKHCSTNPKQCYVTDIDYYIDEFRKITHKYIPITIIKMQSIPEDVCTFCRQKTLEENPLTQTIYCTNCKRETIMLSAANGREANDDSSGVEEDKVENDRIDQMLIRFQGKQAALPKNVYAEIEAFLDSKSIIKQSELRKIISKSPNERHGTSRIAMDEAIKATSNEKYYKDLHLICYVIWNWELPNFSPELEQQVIADYNLTQKYYPELREGRRSRLNSDFRIVRHLLTRGYYHPIMLECKLAATQEVLEYHEKTWAHMCEQAGLPYVSLTL